MRVRLLIDALGGRLIEKTSWTGWTRAGVQVEWFRKPLVKSPFKSNHRLHRKVCVVDGRVAFTGGVGIAEEWCGDARNENEWRDTHLRVEGPAVDGLQSAFIQDWAETGPAALRGATTSSPSSRRPAAARCRSCAARPASAGTTCSRPST